MTPIRCVLPIVLLILIFFLKLLIDRKAKAGDVVLSLIEFPTNIIFLGFTFVVAFTLSSKENIEKGLLVFIIYILLTVFIIFLYRRAIDSYYADKKKLLTLFLAANYFICLPSITYSIILVLGVI